MSDDNPLLSDAIDESGFQEAYEHKEIEQCFEDVWTVQGTAMFTGGVMTFPRSMTIIKNSDDTLTLINAVRLSETGLKALDALGKVTNVLRLGEFHLSDDPFYVARYKAVHWSLQHASPNKNGLISDHIMKSEEDEVPVEGAQLFLFKGSAHPEALLYLPRHELLISADAVQNMETDAGCNMAASLVMNQMGVFHKANVGPGWITSGFNLAFDVPVDDERPSLLHELQRLVAAMPFRNLISAHGTPITDGSAREAFAASVQRLDAQGSLSGRSTEPVLDQVSKTLGETVDSLQSTVLSGVDEISSAASSVFSSVSSYFSSSGTNEENPL